MIKSGISSIGGKFRLRKELLEHTPLHEFFLSLFSGSCIYELNKPRCRYECFNDKDADLINYLLMTRQYPKEFDRLKQGTLGLVSQEICNRIVNGKLQPKNDLERAYFFYYLNKLSFAGTNGGYGNKLAKNITNETIKKVKSKYRGLVLPTVCKDKSIQEAMANYGGISPKASFKGINPKTTRPYTNNDCGLLTPIDSGAIKRLRYVNLTCYDFRKVYKLFHRAFHEKKGLAEECFVYADPPYPGTENYYGNKFAPGDHNDLIELLITSPFHILISIAGECEFYLEKFGDAGWIIKEVYTRYSTDANSQDLTKEYFIMNYDIQKVPKMIIDNQPNLMNFMEV